MDYISHINFNTWIMQDARRLNPEGPVYTYRAIFYKPIKKGTKFTGPLTVWLHCNRMNHHVCYWPRGCCTVSRLAHRMPYSHPASLKHPQQITTPSDIKSHRSLWFLYLYLSSLFDKYVFIYHRCTMLYSVTLCKLLPRDK